MAYVFNSDLLIGEADLETARKAFPRVFFALSNPVLRAVFSDHDARANRAKSRSRRWGMVAVLLATLALMLAASNDLYAGLDREAIRAIGVVGAIAGISSVLIGAFGLMYRDRKVRWLTDRLATERLRQFHFQHFAAHAEEILRGVGDVAAARDFLEKRDRDFENFKAGMLARLEEEFYALVESDDPGDGLLFEIAPRPIKADAEALDEYFRAYDTLRIRRQLDYCNLLLSAKRSLWKHSPARQERFFSAVALAAIIIILALDALVFTGAIADIGWMQGGVIQIAGIWAAFFALSFRALEEGLQPKTEVERMRQYRLALVRSHARYKEAQAPAEKLEAMKDLEHAAFEEMLPFLKSNFEARFVM